MTAWTTRYQLPDDVVLQRADGEALLVKLNAEDLFALNDTGAAIVRCLVDGQDVESLVDDLVRTYAADRTDVAHDVNALVEELVARALLIVRHPDEDPQA